MNAFELSSQLLLPVREKSDLSFETFYSEKNDRAKFMLSSAIDEYQETAVLLVGPEESGKTHLLNAAIGYAESKELDNVCYFSLAELNEFELSESDVQGLFSSFEQYSILALDHLDLWLCHQNLSREFKERCLFNLFNHYKAQGDMLIFALSQPVDALNICLADLLSRLKSGLLISLKAYSDAEKELIMQQVAIHKGFSLEEGVSTFIIKRSGRNLTELLALLDQLDKASLTEQRKLTIPFVKKVLNW